jgi:hypothetical protein
MSQTDTVARSLHDVGLAAWFGGALMGAWALNGAAAQISDPTERAEIATAGWKRWAPVNALAIGAHLVGGGMIVVANRQRVATQSGVGSATAAKTAVTAAALAVTALAGYYGNKLDKAETNVTVEGATEPAAETPEPIAGAQKALRPLQWAVPVLTGALVVLTAHMGEQQRPASVLSGLVDQITPG